MTTNSKQSAETSLHKVRATLTHTHQYC